MPFCDPYSYSRISLPVALSRASMLATGSLSKSVLDFQRRRGGDLFNGIIGDLYSSADINGL